MTLNFSNNGLYLVIVLTFVSTSAQAQSRADYARSLMADQDYYRAISVYKELAFFSRNADSTIFFLSQIGKAYRLSGHYTEAITTFADLADDFKLTLSESSMVNQNLGLAYLGMRVPAQSLSFFQEAEKGDTNRLSNFFLGAVYTEMGEWNKAMEEYSTVMQGKTDSSLFALSERFLSTLQRSDQIPRRSPLVASLFSVVFPGSGQLYCGHDVDALQAFAFVSAFAFTSYVAYKYDSKYNRNYLLTGISISLAGIFHLANIIGAERTAEYFNQRQRDLFIEEIRDKTLNHDF
jgi:tetratricopeptide (TPR) repeat protein